MCLRIRYYTNSCVHCYGYIIIYFDLKKYIKVHENELVEKHIKGLLGRAIAMTVISVCVGVIAIILQIM